MPAFGAGLLGCGWRTRRPAQARTAAPTDGLRCSAWWCRADRGPPSGRDRCRTGIGGAMRGSPRWSSGGAARCGPREEGGAAPPAPSPRRRSGGRGVAPTGLRGLLDQTNARAGRALSTRSAAFTRRQREWRAGAGARAAELRNLPPDTPARCGGRRSSSAPLHRQGLRRRRGTLRYACEAPVRLERPARRPMRARGRALPPD
jgi:hypothetical protein